MTTPILFIGGPIDGRRRTMQDLPNFILVATPPPHTHRNMPLASAQIEPPPIHQETYQLVRMVGAASLYVHTSIKDPLLALIEGYRKEGKTWPGSP